MHGNLLPFGWSHQAVSNQLFLGNKMSKVTSILGGNWFFCYTFLFFNISGNNKCRQTFSRLFFAHILSCLNHPTSFRSKAYHFCLLNKIWCRKESQTLNRLQDKQHLSRGCYFNDIRRGRQTKERFRDLAVYSCALKFRKERFRERKRKHCYWIIHDGGNFKVLSYDAGIRVELEVGWWGITPNTIITSGMGNLGWLDLYIRSRVERYNLVRIF